MITRHSARDLFPYTNRARKPEDIDSWPTCKGYTETGWPDSEAVKFIARYKAEDYISDGNHRIAFLENAGYGDVDVPVILTIRND